MRKARRESNTVKDDAYWLAKHPVTDQMYNGRPLPNGEPYEIDVRHFLWPQDNALELVVARHNLLAPTPDESALLCQQNVVKNLEYVGDEVLGFPEYWLFPGETLAMGAGDCEDGAWLMASLLLHCLPLTEWRRVRVCAGWVQARPTAPQGGHAYVTYCRTTDNEWVVLDWCYLEDSTIAVAEKPLHKDVAAYKQVWFSVDYRNAYSHQETMLGGRLRPRVAA